MLRIPLPIRRLDLHVTKWSYDLKESWSICSSKKHEWILFSMEKDQHGKKGEDIFGKLRGSTWGFPQFFLDMDWAYVSP